MSDYATCKFCSLFWDILVMGTCTYVVFWLDASGWWYVLAALFCIDNCSAIKGIKVKL